MLGSEHGTDLDKLTTECDRLMHFEWISVARQEISVARQRYRFQDRDWFQDRDIGCKTDIGCKRDIGSKTEISVARQRYRFQDRDIGSKRYRFQDGDIGSKIEISVPRQ